MNTTSRILSILETAQLSAETTGFESFHVSALHVKSLPSFELPIKLRLGHMVEKVVSACIKSSDNYKILYENVQIKKDKNTIGELDFIIEELQSNQIIHLELAYKFYLYDPTISQNPLHNWIGPNRRDSLKEKIDKLQQKQFPLLHHEATIAQLHNLEVTTIKQQLCLLASLYIPLACKENFNDDFQQAIKGYYFNFDTFSQQNHTEKLYHMPIKKAWGIDPSEHDIWMTFEEIQHEMQRQLQQKHAPLCWQKHHDTYESFFVVWW
ncbi:DUF1853 family protein [Kordia jejudonensis]|uniref:DUF1853 family protein n=1 Tax=Kordia jejudonensis TaxID=1348245 RepID=UPI0006290CFC|nr:DUF1853 family protein [Kordia jejudonensis]